MSAVRLLSTDEFHFKTKLDELESQIKALSDDSLDSEKARIKDSALEALKLLEILSPNEADSVPSLIGRCYELESSLNSLEVTCKRSESIRDFSKKMRKPQNDVIKKIHEVMDRILIFTSSNHIKNSAKAKVVTDSLSNDPDQRMLQIAITSTDEYQHTNLERKLELLNRTTDLLGMIPRKKRNLEVFLLYAKATSCMTKKEFEGLITSIQEIDSKDSLDIVYACFVLYDASPSESPESRKSKLLSNIKEEGKIIIHVLNSSDKAIEKALLEKANINFEIRNGEDETLLHIFAKIGNLEMVSYLMDKKVNLMSRSFFGSTPYMELRMRGFSIPKGLPDDEFGYNLKMATLIWGLSGEIKIPESTNYNCEWGSTQFAVPEDLSKLASLDPVIKLAFSKSCEKRPLHDICKDIQAGVLTVINTGCLSHSIALVFYEDLLFVCNRGAGAVKGNHLSCFRIDQKKVVSQTIQRILNIRLKKIDESLSFLYNYLPISLSRDGVVHQITSEFSELQPKSQIARNCYAASSKLAIRACLAALSYKKNGDSLPIEVSKSVRAESKMATIFLRKVSYERVKKEVLVLPKKISGPILKHFEAKRIKYRIAR